MKTIQGSDLSRRIEQLVHDHLVACRREAAVALERAFAVNVRPAQMPAGAARPATGPRQRRRTKEEMASLAEQLDQAVREIPGETMAVLADKLGHKACEFTRPIVLLRAANRLKTTGKLSQTRYFPL